MADRGGAADRRISLPDGCCFSLLDAISMPKVSYRAMRLVTVTFLPC
jgi:hypothetical protein